MNSNQNNTSFTIYLGQSLKKKKGEEKFWIKERLKYRIDKTLFDVDLAGNVNLFVEVKNCDSKHWPEDIRIKCRENNLSIEAEQPIVKKIRPNASSKIAINLKRKIVDMLKVVGENLEFEFVGLNEKKNLKYCSESFKVQISGKIFSGTG